MISSPFVFLVLSGLSWFTLVFTRLPPANILGSVPPPGIISLSKEARRNKKHPDKSLGPTNLQIVRNATPVDLAYVDVSGNRERDPHRGARDEKGNWGYVHDETALRRHPPAFPTDRLEQDCQERDADQAMLTEKVFVDREAHDAKKGTKRAKILCIIYAIDASHEKRIPAIRETWGQKCDGFMVGSNKTDASLDTVDIAHAGPEIYENMFQKVRSVWSYVYDYYYDKYDWFHIGGDGIMYLLRISDCISKVMKFRWQPMEALTCPLGTKRHKLHSIWVDALPGWQNVKNLQQWWTGIHPEQGGAEVACDGWLGR